MKQPSRIAIGSAQPLARGAFFLSIANLIFLASGYVIQILVGRYVSPELYGLYGIIIYLVNTINVLFVSGFSRTISRSVAAEPGSRRTIVAASIRYQLPLAFIVAGTFFFAADWVAQLFSTPALAHYFRVIALVFPLYGIRAIYQGLLAGSLLFREHAITQVVGGTSRVLLVTFFIVLGFSLDYILLSYLFSALIVFLLARWYARRLQGSSPVNTKSLLSSALQLTLQAITNPILIGLDLVVARILSHDDTLVGLYTAASTIAKLVLVLPIGVEMGLFPTVSSAYARKEYSRVRKYVKTSVRYLLLIFVPIVSIGSIAASGTIQFVYGAAYADGRIFLPILLASAAFLALTNHLNLILIAVRREWHAQGLGWGMVILATILTVSLTNRFGLQGTAWGMLSTGILGTLIVVGFVERTIGSFLAITTTLRIGFASICAALTTTSILPYAPSSLAVIPVGLTALFVYLLLLLVTRELNANDISMLRSLLHRRR